MIDNTYIKRFIKTLNLCCNDLAEVLLKSIDDCDCFYISFLGRNKYLADDLLDYREHKLKTMNISLSKFLDMCENIGIKQAFEHVFIQPILENEAKFIENLVNNQEITLEYIYNDFQKDINKNILKIVL